MTYEAAVEPTAPARIDAATLEAELGDPTLTVVDARPLSAYNGWRVDAEARGGHVPGAVAFPTAWLDSIDCCGKGLMSCGRRSQSATHSFLKTRIGLPE